MRDSSKRGCSFCPLHETAGVPVKSIHALNIKGVEHANLEKPPGLHEVPRIPPDSSGEMR